MFKYFKKIVFEGVTLTNIFESYRINPAFMGIEFYQTKVVKEGETPESIADDIYGTVSLWWLVLLYNQIRDPFFEWHLTNDEMGRMAVNQGIQLYGGNAEVSNPYDIERLFNDIREINDERQEIRLLTETAARQAIRDIENQFNRARRSTL